MGLDMSIGKPSSNHLGRSSSGSSASTWSARTNSNRHADAGCVFSNSPAEHPSFVSKDFRTLRNASSLGRSRFGFGPQHSAKFFMPEQFKARDIQYVKQSLHITQDIDLAEYQRARPGRYRTRILALLDWAAFSDSKAAFVAEHVQLLAQQQLKPQQIFMATVDFCWKHCKGAFSLYI